MTRGDLGIRLPVQPSAVALGAFGAVLSGLVLAASVAALGVSVPVAQVAAVLVYRLLTFWLPVLPGFVALRRLQERGLI